MFKKIILVPALIIVFMLGIGIVNFLSINKLLVQGKKAEVAMSSLSNGFELFNQTVEIQSNLKELSYRSFDLLKFANQSETEATITKHMQVIDSFFQGIKVDISKQISSQAKNSERTTSLETVLNDIDIYYDLLVEAADMASIDVTSTTMLLENAQSQFVEINEKFELMMREDRSKSHESYLAAQADLQQTKQIAQNSKIVSFSLYAIVIPIAILLSFVLSIRITAQIKHFMFSLRKIADGDLTSRIDNHTKDELGELSKELNEFTENLQLNVIGNIRQIVDELSSAVQHVVQDSIHTEQDTSTQRNEAEGVVISMTQMVQSIQEIASNSANSADASEIAKTAVNRNGELIGKTNTSINVLAEKLTNASSVINSLGEDSQQVEMVVDVIRSISEQTNLLALNAAIEAARAGDHGRGFAVVADEVRSLAQKTQDSTNEIQDILNRLHDGVENVVQLVGSCNEQAGDSVTTSSETHQSTGEINKAVNLISGQCISVATAVEEQTQVAENVQQSIKKIGELSVLTAKNAGSSKLSCNDLLGLATKLEESVSQFKLC